MPRFRGPVACPPKIPIAKKALIDRPAAKGLAGLFALLANGTRLRILHVIIRKGEVSAGEIAEAVAMKPQAVSNQLRKLAGRGVLGCDKRGTQAFYSIVDPCVPELLDRGHCLALESRKRRA